MLTHKEKFENGMRALGLNPNDQEDVNEYLDNSLVGRLKYERMKAETEEVDDGRTDCSRSAR